MISHNFNSQNFKWRVSNPRTTAYFHFRMPFESSQLAGAGSNSEIDFLKTGRSKSSHSKDTHMAVLLLGMPEISIDSLDESEISRRFLEVSNTILGYTGSKSRLWNPKDKHCKYKDGRTMPNPGVEHFEGFPLSRGISPLRNKVRLGSNSQI